MLKNTFCHIPGIGVSSERRLWEAGIRSWDDFDDAVEDGLRVKRQGSLRRHLSESAERLASGDIRYFSDLLPADEQWRLFSSSRDSVAYLDIETNGFAGAQGYITTIALYDGRSIRHYVRGRNLHEFERDIGDYRLVVTYNGKCFDLPYIESHLRFSVEAAHIDLRFLLKSLGYTGGLKGCEKKLGIDRGELDGVDGYFAVLLWQDFLMNGNGKSLETLIAYNIQDVIGLERLMVLAYNFKLERTPFHHEARLPLPAEPENPFRADRETVERLVRRRYRW